MLQEKIKLKKAIEKSKKKNKKRIYHKINGTFKKIDEGVVRLIEGVVNQTNFKDMVEMKRLQTVLFQLKVQEKEAFALIRDFSVPTISNMCLWANGNFNWNISTSRELDYIIEFWTQVFTKVKREDIFSYITKEKGYFSGRIERSEDQLLTHLNRIFPEADLKKPHFEVESSFYHTDDWNARDMDKTEQLRLLDNLDHLLRTAPWSVYDITLELIKSYYKSCIICKTSDSLQVHHLIPRSEGGADTSSNLVVLCKKHHREVHTCKKCKKRWPEKCRHIQKL